MTGRDLILYILKNNLEDEPVYKDGVFIGFASVSDTSVKLGVGPATVTALAKQNQLDHIVVGGRYLISKI